MFKLTRKKLIKTVTNSDELEKIIIKMKIEIEAIKEELAERIGEMDKLIAIKELIQ